MKPERKATIGELLEAVFSLWTVPTTIGKLFKPMGNGVARQTLYQQATIDRQ
jgi:hypothetical protein